MKRRCSRQRAAVHGVQRTPLAQEDHPIELIEGHGAAKRAAEVLGSDGALARGGTPALVLANVYGPLVRAQRGEAGVIADVGATPSDRR